MEASEAIARAGEESRGRRVDDPSSGLASSALPSSDPARPASPIPYTSYVTHIIHLDGPGTPVVDRERLAQMGIETLRLYGRKITAVDGDKEVVLGMKYDSNALVQALEVVLGKKGDAMVRGGVGSGLGRRNTLEPTRREKK